MVPKSDHVTITKIENVHTAHVEKFSDSKNAILFALRREITRLSWKNRFRTVASPGAWPSWIDARRQYILLVVSSFRAAMNMRWMNEFYLHLLICYLCNRALVFLCMHSAKLLWQIILSVRPSVHHILALYRNECTIVKLFLPSGRGMTLALGALPPLQNFKGNSLSGGDKNTLEWKNFQYSTEVAVYYAPDL